MELLFNYLALSCIHLFNICCGIKIVLEARNTMVGKNRLIPALKELSLNRKSKQQIITHVNRKLQLREVFQRTDTSRAYSKKSGFGVRELTMDGGKSQGLVVS